MSKLSAKDKLVEIEELNNDNWFCDNPNGNDVREEVEWLIARIRRLTEALDIMHVFILAIKNTEVNGVCSPVTLDLIDHILARVASLEGK